jgi:hypothetical protein
MFCIPPVVRAESIYARQIPTAATHSRRLAAPTSIDVPASEINSYAKREAATPKLGEFEGGDGGIYIGGGVLGLAILVVLIVLLVR